MPRPASPAFSTPGAPTPSRDPGPRGQPASSRNGPEPFIPESSAPPSALPPRCLCRIVRQVTSEMLGLAAERVQLRRDRRRTACHVRQISMYVCHVVLHLSLTDIGLGFGRDRTTVGHACAVVEDRRDDPAFDEFVSAVERVVSSVFGPAGGHDHG